MSATIVRDEPLSEAMIDATLADSFPASDPPSWTLGRDRYKEREASAGSETAKKSHRENSINPNIGLSEEQRTCVVKILNALLSDEYSLYTKTRNYHWNVTGPQFNDLHKFFEEQYTELNEVVDDVAERARSLDGWALGTLTEFTQHARLTEHPGQYPKAREMIGNLVADHEALVRQLRADLETCAEISRHGDKRFSDGFDGKTRKNGLDVKRIFGGRVGLAQGGNPGGSKQQAARAAAVTVAIIAPKTVPVTAVSARETPSQECSRRAPP